MWTISFKLLLCVSISVVHSITLHDGSKCDRECILGAEPRVCYFKFEVDNSVSMGPYVVFSDIFLLKDKLRKTGKPLAKSKNCPNNKMSQEVYDFRLF